MRGRGGRDRRGGRRGGGARSPAGWLRDRRGASAVEFALVAPLLLLLVLGIVGLGYVLGVEHSVQQLAGEAARAGLAGLSAAEREGLARRFVGDHVGDYALVAPARLGVAVSDADAFRVTLSYDFSGTFLDGLRALVPLPPTRVERAATIQRGGY